MINPILSEGTLLEVHTLTYLQVYYLIKDWRAFHHLHHEHLLQQPKCSEIIYDDLLDQFVWSYYML